MPKLCVDCRHHIRWKDNYGCRHPKVRGGIKNNVNGFEPFPPASCWWARTCFGKCTAEGKYWEPIVKPLGSPPRPAPISRDD